MNSPITVDTILNATGTVSSIATSPLISLTSGSDFTSSCSSKCTAVDVDGTLTLAGPLLSAAGVMIRAGQSSFGVLMDVDGTLTSTTTSGLFSLTNSSVISPPGETSPIAAITAFGRIDLAGPLLEVTSTTFNLTGALVELNNGKLTSTTPNPLISLSTSTLTGGSLIFDNCCGTTITLAGPLFSASSSSVSLSSDAIFLHSGATMSSTSGSALISLDNSSLTAGGGLLITTSCCGVSISLAGPLLSATNSPITLTAINTSETFADLLRLRDASFTSSTTEALIQLSGSPVTVGAANADLVRLGCCESSATMELHGPLLTATNSALSIGAMLLRVTDGSTLAVLPGGSTDPFIQLSGSPVTVGGDLVR